VQVGLQSIISKIFPELISQTPFKPGIKGEGIGRVVFDKGWRGKIEQWTGREGGWWERGGEGKRRGDRKATGKEEFRFPRFSNMVMPTFNSFSWSFHRSTLHTNFIISFTVTRS
jgi:hypothetical protein